MSWEGEKDTGKVNPQDNQNDKSKIKTDLSYRSQKKDKILNENYVSAIFGAFILIISILVLLCLSGKM